jgi:molecular chaperone Hsp33
MKDLLSRFIFEQHQVRGELVSLASAYQQTINGHQYPAHIKTLIGEALSAVALLTATLKMEGKVSLQLQGGEGLKLLLVECTHEMKLRGVAHPAEISEPGFASLVKGGQMIITIAPNKGQRYQGIVPLEADSLANCIAAYFEQSEQLSTRLYLYADDELAAGFLLQQMPASENEQESEDDTWTHLTTLADTLKEDEALTLSHQEIIHRLYHEESIRMFDPALINFKCECSKERCEASLTTVSVEELMDIIQQDSEINMTCDFCRTEYIFDENDVKRIHSGFPNIVGNA